MPPSDFIIAKIGNLEKYLDGIVKLNQEIFQGRFHQPYRREKYERKLEGKDSLVLAVLNAFDKDQVLGDLIAFPRDSSFYIWLMGVDGRIRNQGLGYDLLYQCERFAQEQGFSSTSVKTYNVSSEMQRLLLRRDYLIRNFEENPEDPKQNRVHFSLDLKGRDYRTKDERFAEAQKFCKTNSPA